MQRNSFSKTLLITSSLTAFLTLGSTAGALAATEVEQVAITLTNDNGGACILDKSSVDAGPVTFSVTNKTATALTEVELLNGNRIIGEKENLAPGLPTVSFTVTLGGGNYEVYCPGAAEDKVAFTVTGEATARPTGTISKILDEGTEGYAQYVDETIDAMVVAVSRLKDDIDAGDLEKAIHDYPLARPFYERIESDVDGFVLDGFDATDNHGNLDYLIDMRASNIDPEVGWHGYHAIERDLFEAGKITDETKAYAAELLKNVKLLDEVAPTLEYLPEDLANGAADLLEEVQNTKITGEEEAYSHFDLLDFAGNVEGAMQAFAYLQPGLEKIDSELAERVSSEFSKVRTLLDGYRDASVSGGYKLYSEELKAEDTVKLSQAIQSLQEPLSRIAEKVATAN
nr:iron uptake system protein EfeO [uncultured Cohaesibacter sp.]